jgi:signal peptidase II
VQVFFVAVIILVLDQASKFEICRLMELHESIPVIPGIFHITYILNKGAAFGILENQRWFFLAVAILLFVLYFIFREKIPQHKLVQIGVGLLLGGAMGNALDRFLNGSVVDFFDFRIWPVFNVADIGIVVGVGLLIGYSWIYGKDDGDKNG